MQDHNTEDGVLGEPSPPPVDERNRTHRRGRGGPIGWLWGPPPPPPPPPIDGMERNCWLCWWSFPPPPPPPAPPLQVSRQRVFESNYIVYDAAGNPVHSSSLQDELASTAPPTATTATIVSHSKETNSSMPLPYSSRSSIQYKEIRTLEFRDGDPTSRHYLTIPDDAIPGQVLQVDLGGREMSVRVPEIVSPGEKVIIISPAPPISYGEP